ncbi:MAG: tetratricopeptide repeat protein [Deltaproteobacteria bacterium]|nr:tetratricopeptide repeat protein [Deltaproteobacteria bacterium]
MGEFLSRQPRRSDGAAYPFHPSPSTRPLQTSLLAAVLLAGTLLLDPSGARGQEGAPVKPKTKRVQAVSDWTFKRLNLAHEAIAASQFDEAMAKLDDLKDSPRLNDHEQALVWQSYGYVYGMQEKYEEATAAFEKSLAKDALPDSAQANVQFNVAQLYVLRERYADAVTVFRDWFTKTPDPSSDAHYIYAIALFHTGDKEEALVHGRAAVERAKVPKEPWLQLVLAVYVENKQYGDATAALEALTAFYPKKIYWQQLSAVHAEAGDFNKALAVSAIAYEQGVLTEDKELRQLAQLYLYNRIPYQAALVLEKGMAEGVIPETAETWQLLADAWVLARDRDKAEKPLEQAAARSANGELYFRLAQVQVDRENWAAARQSLARALEKGNLSDPGNAQLLLGIACASDSKWQEARQAFQAAASHEKTAAAATAWLTEVDAELAPEEDGAAEELPPTEGANASPPLAPGDSGLAGAPPA